MLNPACINTVMINDSFFTAWLDVAKRTSMPYMHSVFNGEGSKDARSHCLANFRIAAGRCQGAHQGLIFQDSDLYKYIEAVGFYLARTRDEQAERYCDEIIDLIAEAQLPDGYINTYFIINDPGRRWSNLADDHELYCAGHLMEAACAYLMGTGKRKLLEVACRFADCIDRTFGPEDGKLNGYPGHQEVEIGLLKLYEVTGEMRYLRLSEYFLMERGRQPYYFDMEWERNAHRPAGREEPIWAGFGERYSYMQAHRPLLEQTHAVGHAVRANYMYSAAAHLAGLLRDERLLNTVRTLYHDIVEHKLYVTGGVGSMLLGESYTIPYDLPNDHMYCESCASVALMMLSMRLLNNEVDARYADVLERALYNGVLSGMQLDGTRFFYVNPLSVWRERCIGREDMGPVKPERQDWFDCACCPPNILRTLFGLGQYVYSWDERQILVNLFVGSSAQFQVSGGRVSIEQRGNYPWEGTVRIGIYAEGAAPFKLGVRIPEWSGKPTALLNGQSLGNLQARMDGGYLWLEGAFAGENWLELHLDMGVRVLRCHPSVPFNAGMVALQRGPIVYCLEEMDNVRELWNLTVDTTAPIEARYEDGLLGGVVVLQAQGHFNEADVPSGLYASNGVKRDPRTLKFVPYYAWCNRTQGNMQVWVRETQDHA